jgi:hypothetical protein
MKSKALKPFMTKRLALAQFCSTVRGKGVLALCQALCTLVPSWSARAQSITTFDAPGAPCQDASAILEWESWQAHRHF